ncbi:hypothetical protein B484DRAFT_156884 [Ochromonadaceae sp. CCMP2298]|nr:hypothetical protein B484DRAFT_156884 [Ochromonadaceae sp. CCMP2298]
MTPHPLPITRFSHLHTPHPVVREADASQVQRLSGAEGQGGRGGAAGGQAGRCAQRAHEDQPLAEGLGAIREPAAPRQCPPRVEAGQPDGQPDWGRPGCTELKGVREDIYLLFHFIFYPGPITISRVGVTVQHEALPLHSLLTPRSFSFLFKNRT